MIPSGRPEVPAPVKIFGAPQQQEERLLAALADMVHRYLYDA